MRLDALREGDRVVSATVDGSLTTDEVSLLSIAKPGAGAASAFLRIIVEGGHALNVTAEHHLPVGSTCCRTLAKAKEIVAGQSVWGYEGGGAAVARTVVRVQPVHNHGLHSPVLASGTFPVVDGVVTAFDRIESVTLASYALQPVLAACKATGTCHSVKRLHAFLSGRELSDYIA
jgi:hypothetical protein